MVLRTQIIRTISTNASNNNSTSCTGTPATSQNVILGKYRLQSSELTSKECKFIWVYWWADKVTGISKYTNDSYPVFDCVRGSEDNIYNFSINRNNLLPRVVYEWTFLSHKAVDIVDEHSSIVQYIIHDWLIYGDFMH